MNIKEQLTLNTICNHPRLDTRALGELSRLPTIDVKGALDGLVDLGVVERINGLYVVITPVRYIRDLVKARLG